MTSVHDEETGERDRFKDEFKRFKKKSTDMREVLDLRDENFKGMMPVNILSNKSTPHLL